MKYAVLTGDIINSTQELSEMWLPELKAVLNQYGQEPEAWEIYRGDSFQLLVKMEDALEAAIAVKLSMMQFGSLNARVAIGLGDVSYQSTKVTESNGEAFIRSGKTFDTMKKRTLAISLDKPLIDELLNGLIDFGAYLIDGWSVSTVKVIRLALANPNKTQVELAKMLKVSQANISETFSRAAYDKILQMMQLYRHTISTL